MLAPELLLGGVILGALTLYALLGGADFGGGFWDLCAQGPRKAAQRELIAHALAPVWEVNHVWLILALVLLFSAFPTAFAELGIVLHVPLALLLLGIVGRGSAFAFRAFDTRGGRTGQTWGLLFSVSSLLSPLLLGAAVGAISSGRLQGADRWAWLSLFSTVTGVFALALFAFLAAVYLYAEADSGELAEDFRRRAIAAGVAVGVLAAMALVASQTEAPRVFTALVKGGPALLLHLATGTAAGVTFVALWRRHPALARLAGAAQVALIVVGWGASQYPYLLWPRFTLASAAAPLSTLRLLMFALAAGLVVLVPSLVLLFRVFKFSGAARTSP